MKHVAKMSFSIVATVILLFGFTVTNTHAAKIGEQLKSPEYGWERLDDRDSSIVYTGTWVKSSSPAFYNSTLTYSETVGSTMNFSFKGTKIRLIASKSNIDGKAIPIAIDGVAETFSENITGTNPKDTYKGQHQSVVYEKTGLTDEKHTVTIRVQSGWHLNIDAFDIYIANPITLKASAGDSQVALKWDWVQEAENYTVRYGTESGKYTETMTVTKDVYNNYVIPGLTNGTTYYFAVTATVDGVESDYSNEATATPFAAVTNPILDVIVDEETVTVGQEFVSNIALRNADNIYAEDFTINYDTNLFEYLGYEEVTGYKVCNDPTDNNGNIRFIIASQGKDYGINEDTVIVKLKFKAIAVGTGDVDALKGRIADTEQEYDLDDENCLQDTVTVVAPAILDVNKSGEYTLVDLAIDAFYFGNAVADTDTVNHQADQVIDDTVNDDDLVYIVNRMLINPNYTPNL
ncbi:cohesin domain-containing protein [Paenibacillus sp. TH7-28]